MTTQQEIDWTRAGQLLYRQYGVTKAMASVDGFHVKGSDLELLTAGTVIAKFKARE